MSDGAIISNSRSSIPRSTQDVQRGYADELFGSNSHLRAQGFNTQFETGQDGISKVSVWRDDNPRDMLTLNVQAIDDANKTGNIWIAGDSGMRTFQATVSPELVSTINTQTREISHRIETSADRLLANIRETFTAFDHKKPSDDASLFDMYKRQTAKTLYAQYNDDTTQMIYSGGGSPEQPREMASLIFQRHEAYDPNEPLKAARQATNFEDTEIEKNIWEMAGSNTPIDTENPMALTTTLVDMKTRKKFTNAPLTWANAIDYENTRNGAFKSAGIRGERQIQFKYDQNGQVKLDAYGAPMIENMTLETATGGGRKSAKSSGVPGGSKIDVSAEEWTQREVWDSKKQEMVTRNVLEPIAAQYPRDDGKNSSPVEALNIGFTGFEDNKNAGVVRSGVRTGMLAVPFFVPGSAGMFGRQNNPVFRYSVRRDTEVDLPNFSLAQIADSNGSRMNFDINPANVIGGVRNRPNSRKRIGTMTIDGQEHNLSFRVPQASTNVNDMFLQVPAFVSKDRTRWAADNPNNVDPELRAVTEDDLADIRKALPGGTKISTAGVADRPRMFLSTSNQVAVNTYGGGLKFASYVMSASSVFLRQGRGPKNGVDLPLEGITAEVKQPAILFADTNFASLSTGKQKRVLADYLMEVNSRQGSQLSNTKAQGMVDTWFNEKSAGYQAADGDRTKPEFGYMMNWRDITEFVNKSTGQNLSKYGAALDVFNKVFATEMRNGQAARINPEGQKNLRNLRKYQLGFVGQLIPLRGISEDEKNFMFEQYRRIGIAKTWDDQKIAQSFQQTFNFERIANSNLYNGAMDILDDNGNRQSFWYFNSILTKKPEYRGRGGLNEELAKPLYESDPELALKMGYNPEEMGDQTDNSRSLLQLSAWLGRQQTLSTPNLAGNIPDLENGTDGSVFRYGENSTVSTNVEDILKSYEASSPNGYQDLTERLAKTVGAGDADKGRNADIYFPKLGVSLPTINSAENTLSYEEDGKQIGGGAVDWLRSFKELVDASNNLPDGTRDTETGLAITKSLTNRVANIFESGGDSMKERFRKEIPYSGSLRFSGMSILGNNQVWATKETRRNMLRSAGLPDRQVREFEKTLTQTWKAGKDDNVLGLPTFGVPMIGMRLPPQGGADSISNFMFVPDQFVRKQFEAVAKSKGEKFNWNRFERDAEKADTMFTSQMFGAEHFGDYDFDPGWFAWLVKNRNTDAGKSELYSLVDAQWQGLKSVAPDRSMRIEEQVLNAKPNEINKYIENVSASLKSMSDITNAGSGSGDIMKTMKNMGVGSQNLRDMMTESMDVHEVATKAMGTTYNFRRAIELGLSMQGFDRSEVSEAMGMSHGQYQWAIDKLLTGPQNSGTRIAKLISNANAKMDKKTGLPYISLSTSTVSDTNDGVSSSRMYFDNTGASIRNSLNFVARVAASDITINRDKAGKGGESLDVMPTRLLSMLFSTDQNMAQELFQVLDSQDESFGSTASARITGFWDRRIAGEKTTEGQISMRQSIANTPIYQAIGGVAMSKPAYDEKGNELPGNFGEGAVQAALLEWGKRTGNTEAVENYQANAIGYSLKTGKRGVAPAHLAAIARNRIGERIQQFRAGSKDIAPGILSAFTDLSYLGRYVTGNKSQIGMGLASNQEIAYDVVRGMSKNAPTLDVETTGIREDLKTNGALWNLGLAMPNGATESITVRPRMTEKEYRENYEYLKKQSNGDDAWMANMPHPDDFDKTFHGKQTFGQIWAGGFGDKLLSAGEWSSYNRFDYDVMLKEMNTELAGSGSAGERLYWQDQIMKFQNTKYTDLYQSPGGQNVLSTVFGTEIDAYNKNHPQSKKEDLVHARLQDMAKALAADENDATTADMFGNGQEQQAFKDFVANSSQMQHLGGYDAELAKRLEVMARRRVASFDNSISARNNAINQGMSANSKLNRPASQSGQPQGAAPTDPNAIQNFFGLSDDDKKRVRASWLNMTEDEIKAARYGDPEAVGKLAMHRANEILDKKYKAEHPGTPDTETHGITTRDALLGQQIHEGTQKEALSQDPDLKAEQRGEFTTPAGTVVSATADLIREQSGTRNKFGWDIKPFAVPNKLKEKYKFQMWANMKAHGLTSMKIVTYSQKNRTPAKLNDAVQEVVGNLANVYDPTAPSDSVPALDETALNERADTVRQLMRENPEVESMGQFIAAQVDTGNTTLSTQTDPTKQKQSFPEAIKEATRLAGIFNQQKSGSSQQARSSQPQPAGSGNPFAPSTLPSTGQQQSQPGQPQVRYVNTNIDQTRVEDTQRSIAKLNHLATLAAPFFNSIQTQGTGAPGLDFMNGLSGAVNDYDVVNGKSRIAAEAASKLFDEFLKMPSLSSPVLLEAAKGMPQDVLNNVFFHPGMAIRGSETFTGISSSLGTLRARLEKTAKGAAQREESIRIHKEFFGRQDVKDLSSAFETFQFNSPSANPEEFFKSITDHAASSPYFKTIRDMNSLQVPLNEGAEALNNNPEILEGFWKYSTNPENKKDVSQLERLAAKASWTVDMRRRFDAIKTAKSNVSPTSLAYKMYMADENVLQAQAKVDYLTQLDAISQNASGDFSPKSNQQLASAEQRFQGAVMNRAKLTETENLIGFPAFQGFTEIASNRNNAFGKAFDEYRRNISNPSMSLEEKMTASITAGGGDSARLDMGKALGRFTSMDPSLRGEFGGDLRDFMQAIGIAKKEKMLDVREHKESTLLDPTTIDNYVKKMQELGDSFVAISNKLETSTGRQTKVLELQNKAVETNTNLETAKYELEKARSEKVKAEKAFTDAGGDPLNNLAEYEGVGEATRNENAKTNVVSRLQARMDKYHAYLPKPGEAGQEGTDEYKAAEDTVNKEEERAIKSGGSFFRHAFSGFGLMYLRTTANIASEPLREGYRQRLKSQQEIGGTLFGILGGSRSSSPDEDLARAQGLYLGGQGWEGMQRAATNLTKNDPGIVSGLSTGIAGLSMYGASMWLASQAPQNRNIFSGYMFDAKGFNALGPEAQQEAYNKGTMRLASGIALGGILASDVMNIYGAYSNPNVTSRTIANRSLSTGNVSGWDVGGFATGALAGGLAGAALGSTFGGVGAIPGWAIGAAIGGTAGAAGSQKDYFAQLFNPTIQAQTARGAMALGAIGSGYGLNSSMNIAGYSPSQMSEYANQVTYSMGADANYTDISQQALATTVGTSLKYGYNITQDQTANLARQLERGNDLVGISRALPALAGTGGLNFMADSGQTKTVQMYSPVSVDAIGGNGNVNNAYGLSANNNFGRTRYSTEQELLKSLNATQQFALGKNPDDLQLGGQGDNLASVRFVPGANGGYDVYGTQGNSSIVNLGTTADPAKTAAAINTDFANGSPVQVATTIGEKLLGTLQNELKKPGSTLMDEESLTKLLPKLAESGFINRTNYGALSNNGPLLLQETTALQKLSGTNEEQAYLSKVKLHQARLAAGEDTYADAVAPSTFANWTTPQMSPNDLTTSLAADNAKINIANRKQALQAMNAGMYAATGIGSYPSYFNGLVANLSLPGLEGTEGTLSLQGTTFGNMLPRAGVAQLPSMQLSTAGFTNNTIDSRWTYTGGYTNMLGPAGEQQRVATGLGWGQSGNDFGWGGFSQSDVLANIFGSDISQNNPATGKSANPFFAPYKLQTPMTMMNGSKITQLQGYEGINAQMRDTQYADQLFQFGQQQQSMDLSFTYTHATWGNEDKQRALGWAQQEFGFGMQQKQMDLGIAQQTYSFGMQQKQMDLGFRQQEFGFGMQARQMALGQSQFSENMGLQKQQMTMQRAWTQEDWGINQNVRDMQWGWKQEDFNEEKRFMTGRQRRLAERQMKRDTTMHNVEEDQVGRSINRQQESWKLEDERIAIQIKQFGENKKLQQEQLQASIKFYEENKKYQLEQFTQNKRFYEENKKLQQEQLNASISFFNRGKQLQIEATNLQRANWEANFKLQQQGLQHSKDHAAIMKDLNDKLALTQIWAAQAMTAVNNIGELGMKPLLAQLELLIPKMEDLLKPFTKILGIKNPASSGGSGTAGGSNPKTPNSGGNLLPTSPFYNSNPYNTQPFYQAPSSNLPVLTGPSKITPITNTINLVLDKQIIAQVAVDAVTTEVMHAH